MLKKLMMTMMALMLMVPAAVSAGDKDVELLFVEWAETVASTNVIKVVLEDQGYDVEITPVSAAVMWTGIASGDADGLTGAWLPVTHGHYLEKYKDDIDFLGENLNGAKIGLAVPTYAPIDSIEDLKKNPGLVDNEIVGIDPGAGIMSKAEKAIEAYGLKDIELVESSGPMMIAVLSKKYKEKEPVVVTAWTPHYMFSRWDLKYLKDPKKIFGETEFIASVARKGLKQDKPEVHKILDNFYWELDDCQQVMLWSKDTSSEEAARKWVDENQDKVARWIK